MRDNIIASVKKSIKNYGHLYVLAIISAFTLATRLQGLNNLTNESGEIILLGNDPWYHFRATMFQIENYPYFLKFDPLSGYPEGAAAGTFGTLFDFVHATLALIIGLGNPSEELVKEILILTPPIFGLISVLSVYLLAKYITGSKWGGVSASLILSLLPGTFYRRTRVGFGDHQAMEVFMLLLTVFAIVKFIDYAEDNHIILELIKDYNNIETKTWAKYGIGAVVTLYLYYLVWPPAMMIFGLIAITATIYVVIGYERDIIAEYGLLSMAILSVINLLMVLVRFPTMDMQVAKPSIIHIGVAVISILLTGSAYLLYKKGTEDNWDNKKFYGLYASILIIPSTIAFIIEPSIINGILDQIYRVLGYPFGLGGGSQVQTIGEERGASILGLTVQQYGFMLISSIAGIAYTIFDINKDISNKDKFASKLFLVVFALFITVISIRTVRFNYYLAPVVSIFASVIIYQLVRFVDIPKKVKDIQGYHIISIIIIVFLFTPVLLVPVQVGTVYQQQSNMNQGYQDWQEPLEWLDENSEDVGIGTYEKASKSTYEYPDESYGVMSWWDYGHWITVTSDRPPVANPFQQHAYNASDFLMADSPDEAEDVMENLDEDSEARYVAVDWQMVSPYSKYGAIVQFNDEVNLTDTITRYYETRPGEGASLSFIQKDQRYYESMMARLYYGHGSRMSASQYTIDYNAQGAGQEGQTVRTVTPELSPITKHNNSVEAKEYADNNTEVSVGGIGNQPPEAVESLDHYRLVKTSSSLSVRKGTVVREYRNLNSTSDSEIGVRDYDTVPSTVKLFEKVDGSDIQITNLQPNTSISIGVPVNDPATNQTFVYSKRTPVDSNGVADFTVPYSTTGYDNVSNAPAVRGTQSYQVSYTGSNQLIAQFAVPEETVQSDTDPIRLSI